MLFLESGAGGSEYQRTCSVLVQHLQHHHRYADSCLIVCFTTAHCIANIHVAQARSKLFVYFLLFMVFILMFSILFHSFNAVHAIISRGSPGTTLLERSAFMRASKYNIGGVLHSLLDVSGYCFVIVDYFDFVR